MNTAPRPTRRLALALLPLCLAAAGGAVAANNEVALQGPNGNGSAADCDHAPATAADAASSKPVPTAPAKRSSTRVKPVVTVRGGDGDDASSHTPRWHSFLPGMFR